MNVLTEFQRFISMDCGAPAYVNYTESKTGIKYISDANFINTGVSGNILSELKSNYQRQMWTVRSFPEGKRNCYKINITRGSKYLIRASFLYGNYDGLNMLPQFDLLLGPNLWDTVTIYIASEDQANEIIYVPSLDYVQICLVDTGHGTPFISAIEFRTLINDVYVTQFGSLEAYYRLDLGSNNSYRYNYDVYDRYWSTYSDDHWTPLNASIPVDYLNQNRSSYKLPAIVMSTAVTPVNASDPLVIRWEPDDETEQFYVYMHFTEIQVLAKNEIREFNITQNGDPWYQKFSPRYRGVNTLCSVSAISGKEIAYSLEKTKNSTLPPIINAIEIYRVIDFSQSDTHQGDDILKRVLFVFRDLSNNKLNDEVPDFLSQLQHLKILNLENNNLFGSIPSALVEKSMEGSLSLRVGQNPYLCKPDQCNEKKKKNIVMPLVASVCGVWIFLMAVAAISITLKTWMVEKDQSEIPQQYTKQDDSVLQFEKQKYSYSVVLKITNNFNTIVGKGGFGTVYLGYIDDTPVAVKMLSSLCVCGYQQFQAEVKLLMRVHHKNLTSLIGYCNEGTNKSLIYEYMANGNLQEHLFGLEYLQNGCKPPIIHRDIKSTNILLNEHFQAKLSDFGLSKIIPTDGESHETTAVAGTLGYLDPHYCISNRLSEKSDIYSFGVVLLEIITSQPVMAINEEKTHIIKWVRSLIATGDIKAIVDSRLKGDFDINSAWKALEIAMACVSLNPDERPMMSVIAFELKETLAAELARTQDSGADPRDSVEPVSMNLDTKLMPLARYYITNKLTEKSDVYSFGVVLLEIITSQPVIAKNQQKTHISQWVRSLIAKGDIKAIVDSRLEGAFDSNSVWKAVEIATACVSANPNRRPIISVIVSEVKESLAMELARTKYRDEDSRDSVRLVTMNLVKM
uniref:LRR receptor-like serine/threonine-protein kinase At1g51880 family n=1 Tax=Cajanus cajan TaxID=3821 RepID=A0A151SU44_CAJCA|nr:putative LRR receptor-like serine/threonine-protein kinase At1g51880 family [Cajanus cajan]